MSDNFPELSEAAAPPDVAAVYAEIRTLSGVPMVALIFRHLATLDGVLQEVWQAIGPLLRAGLVQDRAWRVARAEGSALELPAVEVHARAAIGLDGAQLDRLHAILDAYNRANPVNLLCMLCLLRRLNDGAPPAPLPAKGRWSPPAPIAALPPMVAIDAMAPEVRWLLNDFGLGDRSRLDPVVPSLFRHLAEARPLLAILHVLLAERFRDGSIERVMGNIDRAMQAEAERLARYLPPLELVAAEPGVRDVLRRFTAGLIPQMIVIGFALRRSFS